MNCASYCLATGRWHQFDVGCTVMRKAGPTEGVLEIPDDVYQGWVQRVRQGATGDLLQEYINQKTGLAGDATRYALIDKQTGLFKNSTLICCFACNPQEVDGCDLIAHPAADETWPYDRQAKTFTKPAHLDPKPKGTAVVGK